MAEFKDLFSKQSNAYSKFRPTYPSKLYNYLASLTDQHEACWDVGTGNGQAAVELTKYFKKVFASDPSDKQISKVTRHPQVDYFIGTAEESKLPSHCVSLITVAQALHWIKLDQFLSEAKRVLKPHGLIAAWTYNLAETSPAVDAVTLQLYNGILGSYWEKERKLVEDGYSSVHFPAQEIKTPKFEMTATWSFEHYVGFLTTWSALQSYIQKNSKNPLEDILPALQNAWGTDDKKLITWDLTLRVWKI